jgi:hypothetical protein
MKNEFEEFLKSSEIAPPQKISENIICKVKADLNPSSLSIFRKLSFIQVLTGFITLLFCPQFGIGLTSGMGLMGVLMRYGDNVCMAGCGAIFLSGSALVSTILLRPEEVRVLKKNLALQFPILALATLGVFICLGAPVISMLGLSWFVGSVIGGVLSFEVGQKLRHQFT